MSEFHLAGGTLIAQAEHNTGNLESGFYFAFGLWADIINP